jgi:acetyl esterase/lipase
MNLEGKLIKKITLITFILTFTILSATFCNIEGDNAVNYQKWVDNDIISAANISDFIVNWLTNNQTNTWTNISYANFSQAEKMDIYLPNSTTVEPSPVIIFIHGGGGYTGDKANLKSQNILPDAISRGYAVISINYRLSGEAAFPAQINDVKTAIKYVRANSAVYNLNPDKIVLWGPSMGGWLAALAGTSGDVKDLEDPNLGYANVSSKVRGVVDLYGPINFWTMDEQYKEKGVTKTMFDYHFFQLIGQEISVFSEGKDRLSPDSYISADDPFFIIQHGTDDKVIPYQQSENFVNKLRAVLGNDTVQLYLIDGAEHGGPQFRNETNVDIILDFIDMKLISNQ